jgi:hypothetical protein
VLWFGKSIFQGAKRHGELVAKLLIVVVVDVKVVRAVGLEVRRGLDAERSPSLCEVLGVKRLTFGLGRHVID